MTATSAQSGRRLTPVSPAEALRGVASGDRIYLGGMATAPHRLIDALIKRAPTLRDVEIVQLISFGKAPHVAPECASSFRITTLFVGPDFRGPVAEGRADFVPVFLNEAPRLFGGRYPIDWALVQLSPPDRHGFCSTGVSADATLAAIRQARHVIAEINPQMPRTHGDTSVHIDRLDAITEVDHPLFQLPPAAASDAMTRISEYIAEMIADGDCLQIGIGAIPNAVLTRISDRRHLGIHTEMLTDGIVDLYYAGAIDGSRKTVMPGKIVCTFAAGQQRLYDFVDANPMVEFHGADFTNDPYVIGQNDNVVAVNSAIQIDLTGQVDADSIGSQLYSGIGGQVDFIRGAARSRNGRPIIAVPSTARHGTVSRIVPTLSTGAGVVTSRGDVHHVVTEYGRVDLFGMGVHERARALISIAHPDFREELDRKAHELRLTWRDRLD
ncbi:MAG: acetyl-CoA hydrolase/transferase C-terminal domain-containing protein [Acetobacteraceae bacterium]